MNLRGSIIDAILYFLDKLPPFKGRDRIRCILGENYPHQRMRRVMVMGNFNMRLALRMPFERGIWLGMWNMNEIHTLEYLLGKGDTFVDVGANLGLWSLAGAEAVGSNGHVHAFEANPLTYKRLVETIHLNGLEQNLIPHCMAVSEKEGDVYFENQREHYLSRVVTPFSNNSVQVSAITLDDYLMGKIDALHGIKIDVEGHEWPVIQGGLELLRHHRPWIVLEFNSRFVGKSALGDWPVFQALKQLGYEAFNFSLSEGKDFSPADVSMCLDKGYCDILFRHPHNG